MYHLLRADGHKWNHKRIYRIYLMMGLNLRRKRKRRVPARVKAPHILPINCNVTWSMDFMYDTLASGRSFRTFNVIDDHNRESLLITIDFSLSSSRIIRELDRLIEWRGAPEVIRVDNGPEFTSARFEAWARKNTIKILFIQPGKPTQNSLIERFNGSFRRELLNAHLFYTIDQVREESQLWQYNYNHNRPHHSLNNQTPIQFVKNRGEASFPSVQFDYHLLKKSIFMNVSVFRDPYTTIPPK
jgi:putative transposase